MTCTCPKCQAQIEVDPSVLPEKGAFLPCPECKNRFWAAKEAYARMSLKKAGNIYCDQCGQELDHKLICSTCGVMYPDYYLVQASKPPLRQVEKVNYLTMSFSLKPARPTYSYEYAYKGEAPKKTTSWAPSFNFRIVGAVAVVLILAVSIGYFYKAKQAEQRFVKDYMRALYAIKTGDDISLETCAKIAADWKSKGQFSVPRISVDDESRLNKVKDVADRYMLKLNNPPKKFNDNKMKLANLYEIYTKTNALALAPSGSLSGFENATAKSQSDFSASITALRDSMPDVLSKEFKIAQTKYKRLKNI